MKIFKDFFIKVLKIFNESYLSIHIFLLFLSLGITYLSKNIQIDNSTFSEIINGMGILSSFLILVIDKLNLDSMSSKYFVKVKCGFFRNKEINEGKKFANTIFSLVIHLFLILGLNYIFLILGIQSRLLLMYLIILVFSTFILSISTWQSYTTKNLKR